MKIFPRLINAILAHTGESRATLCKRTGISKTSLNDFLGGRKDLSFDAVIALVAAFPRYNARWLLTGAKSQAMLEHQAKLDAAKVVTLPPAIFPSDGVVISRFKDFLDSIDARLISEQHTPWSASACTIGCDLETKDTYTYINAETAHSALMQLIKLYSGKRMVSHVGGSNLNHTTAPDFFAPIPWHTN